MLTIISLVATAWVLVTYWWLVKTGEQPPFNLANAIGCIPILVVEIGARTWAPLVLTATFGLVGLWGVIKDEWRAERIEDVPQWSRLWEATYAIEDEATYATDEEARLLEYGDLEFHEEPRQAKMTTVAEDIASGKLTRYEGNQL